MILKLNDVTLRPINIEDHSILFTLMNDQNIINAIVGFSLPTNESEHIEWMKNLISNKNNARFMIDFKGQTVGYISLSNINKINRSAELGIKILSVEFHGKGIGTISVQLIIKYAFEYLNLRRVETSILEENNKSIRLFSEKLKWAKEGIKINSVFRNGNYHNEVLFAIIRN
jgi:RimJ/RimL family protein N-acetyltransferase